MGSFRIHLRSESTRLVRGYVQGFGLSPRSSLSEKNPVIANQCAHWCGNPVDDLRSREVRVSPLQRLSVHVSWKFRWYRGCLFALKSFDFGAFFILIRPESQTQTKGENKNGKRITQGV